MIAVKVILLDGSTKEYKTYDKYWKEVSSLTLHSHNDKPACVKYYYDDSIYSEAWRKKDKRHREGDKPAYIIYSRDGSVDSQYWYKKGKEITEEEAKKYAAKETNMIVVKATLLDGSTREFESYDEYCKETGSLTLHSHNDKPAYVGYRDDGSICYKGWYKEDKCHRESDKSASMRYNVNRSIWYQDWWKEGKQHREGDKPALIWYNRDGCVHSQEWWKEGKQITKEEAKKHNNNQPTTKENTMMNTIKAKAKSMYEVVKPYEKYIFLGACLVALDYFVFKGQLSGKIKELGGKLADRIIAILDKAIDKIVGGETNVK